MTTLRVLTINFGKMTVSGIWEKYMSLLDQCGKHIPNASVTHGVLGDPGMVGTMGKVSNYLKVFKV